MLAARRSARRGAVSTKLDLVSASGIRRFFELIASSDGVISLGVGEPDFSTPNHISQAAIRSIDEGLTSYTSNYGLSELRVLIARHLERLYGVEYDPYTEIIVTTGVSEALNLATQAILDEGDEVLSTDPSYVAYMPNVIFAGGRFTAIPTPASQGFQLDAAALEQHVAPETKALLIGYPCNPTGAVMERSKLEAIADVVERHDLFVISDEIYDRLVYGVEHVCFSSLPRMKQRTILLGGFSKSYAMTGWRLGWVCAPAFITDAMMRIHQYVMMSAPTAAQYAAIEALTAGEEDVQGMVGEYARRRALVVRACRQMGLELVEPHGAFYAFPSVASTGLDDEAFAERLLLEERVAVVPGSAFGPGGAGHVRICYAQKYDLLEEALARMARFVRRYQASPK
ncbi:MAG TPA: aminotransferase class I/II-fold pyridoxal phosphate-dependent enzyme [Dehalococcoidia bacterium]|nr:aminotransferase class I/II-fold pyridoxal phosphate-dependent enzyme [Dehalococcoidia bacterium]